jgi:hypothetical protein
MVSLRLRVSIGETISAHLGGYQTFKRLDDLKLPIGQPKRPACEHVNRLKLKGDPLESLQ